MEGGQALLEVELLAYITKLSENDPYLTELDLGHNQLGDSTEMTGALVTALRANFSLTRLNLSCIPLSLSLSLFHTHTTLECLKGSKFLIQVAHSVCVCVCVYVCACVCVCVNARVSMLRFSISGSGLRV